MVRIDRFILNAISKDRSRQYVIAYDISSDKERNKVDDILKAYGFRIQFSVFECHLSRKQYADLIEKISLLKISTGFVKLYRIEKQSKAISIGADISEKSEPEDPAYVV